MGTAKRAEQADATFEPENIDLEQIFTNAQVLNPGMVAFRIAAVTLNKSQAELADVVHGLKESDALEEVVELLVNADRMFQTIHATCLEAERRIGICMAMREVAHDGDGRGR